MGNSFAMSKHTFLEQIQLDDQEIEKRFLSDLKQQRKTLISHIPKRQQLYYIYHLILNQGQFTYSMCLTLAYYFRCFACSCRKDSSKSKFKWRQNSGLKHMQLDKGKHKLNRDLDIINLLEMVKDYHLMRQVLFNQDDRFFLALQHRDMICESSTENEE